MTIATKIEGDEGDQISTYSRNIDARNDEKSRSFPSLYTLDQPQSISITTLSHHAEVKSLNSSYELLFNSWSYQLNIGFHLLLYGYGSKRNLIQTFISKSNLYKYYQIFVIDGIHPELSIETVMNCLLIQYIQPYMKYIQPKRTMIRKNTDRMTLLVNRISQIAKLSSSGSSHNLPKPLLLVILHMDGIWMRQDKFQSLLSMLAKPETQCRVLSCIDHISSPLLLSNCHFPRWKWICHDVTTFVPYINEELAIIKETLQGSIGSNMQHMSTLTVLSNLTINARKIYALLSKVQLFFASIDEECDSMEASNEDIDLNFKHKIPSTPKRNLISMINCTTPIAQSPSLLSGLSIDSIKYPANTINSKKSASDYSVYGLTFAQFYQLSMENFLTSNEISFRTQLSEFFDHKIISSKKLSDGTEVLYLPFSSHCIQDILSELESIQVYLHFSQGK